MRRCIAIFVLLAGAIGLRAQSPWSTTTFTPAPTLTGTGQTSAPVILQRSTATRDSYSAGKIIVTGVGLTTATFSILGSTNSGASYNVLATEPCSSPGTFATSQTVTASPSCYEVNLSSLYSVEFTTSGTFTGTSITLLLTANPNAQITRNGNGGGGGAGVQSINGVAGAFTFDGSGVSCSATTCDFTGGAASPGGTTGAMQFNNAGALGGLNGTGIPVLNGAAAPTIASAAQLTTQVNGVNCELGGTCNTPLICGGTAGTCPEQQINPAPCGTTTSLGANITSTQTTIPVVSAACLVAPVIVTVTNNSGPEFIGCTGISSNTLTGCTRGFYTLTPGTGVAQNAGGSVVKQVVIAYSQSSTTTPGYYVTQDISTVQNGTYFANGSTTLAGGATLGGSVSLEGTINAGAINSAQAEFLNPSSGTGCATVGPLWSGGGGTSGNRSWQLLQTSSSCTLGANNLPPNAFGALVNATTGVFPPAGTPFSWYADTSSIFHATGGFAIGANTVIPATTTGFQGNSAGVDIPMSIPWTTPSAITSICHDANGNVTDASCPGGGSITTPTTGDLLATTATSGTVTNLIRTTAAYGQGDSYIEGIGMPNPEGQGIFGLFLAHTPSTSYANNGVGGTTVPQITNSSFAEMQFDPALPNAVLNDGGLNDGNNDTCGGGAGTNCTENYQLALRALLVWEAVPYSFGGVNYKLMASSAASTGTVAVDTTIPITSGIFAPAGTAMHIASSGGTLTFNVPFSASPVVDLLYPVVNSATGTFTVSVDGTPQTDFCSGTTTFSTGPCGGTALALATSTVFAQEFTVTPNATHTVVVTSLSATTVPIIGVAYVPPVATVANVNRVFLLGTPPATGFSNTSTYNAAGQAIANQENADGFTDYFVDLVNGVTAGGVTTPPMTSPIYFSTTATATCSASTSNGHPNSCGVPLMDEDILLTELKDNAQVSAFNMGGTSPARMGTIYSNLNVTIPPLPSGSFSFSSTNHNMNVGNAHSATMSFFQSGNEQFGIFGLDFQDGSTGDPWSGTIPVTKIASDGGWALFQDYDNTGLGGPSHYTDEGGLDFTTGNTSFKGVDSRKLGTLTAAATIAPTTAIITLTGSTPIATITASANMSTTYGGCLEFISASGTTTTYTTGGNIANPSAVGASGVVTGPAMVLACFAGTLWYLK
jgi:hypothetical protein